MKYEIYYQDSKCSGLEWQEYGGYHKLEDAIKPYVHLVIQYGYERVKLVQPMNFEPLCINTNLSGGRINVEFNLEEPKEDST